MAHRNHQSALLLNLAAASGFAAADTYRYEATVGTTIPDVQDNYTIGLFEKALANPNATRTVAFNPFAPVQDLIDTSSPLYQNWNLRKPPNSKYLPRFLC